MTTSAIRSDDLDSDLSLLNRVVARGKGASAIPTKEPTLEEIKKSKKFYSGANPELQPDAEYDYDKDSDLALLNTVKPKPETQKEKKQLSRADAFMEVIAKPIYHNLYNAVVEPAMALATGAQAGVVGPLTGLVAAARSGKFGTQEGVNIGKQQAENYAAQTTYQPRSEIGRQIVGAIGNVGSAVGPLPEAQVFQPLVSPAASQLGSQFNALRNARIEPVNAPVNLANTSKFQSGGSAAAMPENVLRGNIDAALVGVSPELEKHIRSAPPQAVNIPALETRALEEKHGVNLLKSQRINDTQGYSEAWNGRAKNGLQEDFQQQPKQLAKAFEESKIRHANDISSEADASELGQHEINGLAEKDAQRVANIDAAYKKFRDEYVKSKQAKGLPVENDFPVNGNEFLKNANRALINESLQFDVPESVQKLLNVIKENEGKMNYQEFLNLDKRLSAKQREGSGSERAAAGVIRKQLNDIPLEGEAAELQPFYENAKALAKERFNTIESNPAYKAAIEAAEDAKSSPSGVSLQADKFHKTFVSNASPEAIRRMKAEIPEDHIAHQAITFGELDRAKRAITNANESRTKTDQFAEFLRNNKSKLRESLPPEAMQDVMEIGLLNSKIAKPESGTFNYSNSYSALLGDLAKQGLLGLGEAKLATATGGASILPVAGLKGMVQKFSKDAFAEEQRNPHSGLVNENAVPRIEISGVPTGQ